jgi:hypothetical protein
MVIETCTMKLSPDGKRLTMAIKGSGDVAYSSTQVFDRQAVPK